MQIVQGVIGLAELVFPGVKIDEGVELVEAVGANLGDALTGGLEGAQGLTRATPAWAGEGVSAQGLAGSTDSVDGIRLDHSCEGYRGRSTAGGSSR